MSNLEPSLARQTRARPKEIYRVIVRVDGDLDARRGELETLGFTIVRQLRLIRGYGATAPGTCIRRAQKKEWILSIEPDSILRTMDTPSG